MDNSKDYFYYIKDKYTESSQIYGKIYDTEEPIELFLRGIEKMNVYPLFPRMIKMPLKKPKEDFKTEFNKSGSKLKLNLTELKGLKQQARVKVMERESNETKEFVTEMIEKHPKSKGDSRNVRTFFDYEIRDKVGEILPDSYITNAWCKLYEILYGYNMFMDFDGKTIETFHICEHPGAFIYATSDYISIRLPDKKHKFKFQSLKPKDDKKIFKAEKSLLEEHKDDLDYGKDGTGDITNPDNILHYVKKYSNNQYQLITSDCGLDCSKDFPNQETDLLKIFMGALLCAIGIAKKGSHYVGKLFSFSTQKTIEMLFIGSLFFETADIVRPLTTKTGSAEVYAVFKNFNGEKLRSKSFDVLMEYYRKYDDLESVVEDIDDLFLKRIFRFSSLMYMLQITNNNLLLSKLYNVDYINHNVEVKAYIKQQANYLAEYFVKYIGLDGINTMRRGDKDIVDRKLSRGISDDGVQKFLDFFESERIYYEKEVYNELYEDKFLKVFDVKYREFEFPHVPDLKYSFDGPMDGGGSFDDVFKETMDFRSSVLYENVKKYEKKMAYYMSPLHDEKLNNEYYSQFIRYVKQKYDIDYNNMVKYAVNYRAIQSSNRYIYNETPKNMKNGYLHLGIPDRYRKKYRSEIITYAVKFLSLIEMGGNIIMYIPHEMYDIILLISHIFSDVHVIFVGINITSRYYIIAKNKINNPKKIHGNNSNLHIKSYDEDILQKFNEFAMEIYTNINDKYAMLNKLVPLITRNNINTVIDKLTNHLMEAKNL